MSIPTLARYQIDGESVSVAEMAERLGVGVGCAYGRLKRAQHRNPELTWKALGLGAPMPRQQRIIHFVLDFNRDAFNRDPSLYDIVDGIAAEDTERDRAKLTVLVSAHLHQLKTARKLMCLGTPGNFTYRGTRTSLVDRRGLNRKKISTPQPSKPPKAAKVKPEKPAREPKAPKPAKVVKAAARAAPPERVQIRVTEKSPYVVPNAALTPPRGNEPTSASIAADIAAFQARGGKIQRLKPGESSHSIRAQQEAFLAARGRGRVSNAHLVSNRSADNDDTLDADDLVDVA